MKSVSKVLIPLLLGMTLGAVIFEEVVPKIFPDKHTKTRVINIEVKDFPHKMSLGVFHPLTDTTAGMHCDTSITDQVDLHVSVITDDRLQSYGCIRVPVEDL